MKHQDLDLDVYEGFLSLSGQRKFEELARGVKYQLLPKTVKIKAIQATDRNGSLEIHMLNADEAKLKLIALTAN